MIAIWAGLKSFGNWIANNPAVQWIIGAIVFILALLLWGERREGQGRRQERVRQKEVDLERKEEADASAEEIIEEEKTDADQAIDAGERAVRSEPGALERMSDEEWELTFGRKREAGDAGYRGEG
jgi:type VI protein secretion system component VasK